MKNVTTELIEILIQFIIKYYRNISLSIENTNIDIILLQDSQRSSI
ncbi:4438_t:CDS:2 [Funneliformis caledonium]|uniref:4438_t:CDS:1 n=1 Tax=Funneliformis caledonium TaxID=1117310 RepID=A0A9N8WPD8_9GLOM|nr:4438_t:CDS:2 [Funneliformis caledonium]